MFCSHLLESVCDKVSMRGLSQTIACATTVVSFFATCILAVVPHSFLLFDIIVFESGTTGSRTNPVVPDTLDYHQVFDSSGGSSALR